MLSCMNQQQKSNHFDLRMIGKSSAIYVGVYIGDKK